MSVTQGDLISWLASEFAQSTHPKEDTWQNFKSLCEAQKPKENKTPTQTDGSDNVEVPASRVCYLDKGLVYVGYSGSGNYEKGNLGLWSLDNPGYDGFNLFTWSNLQLWEYFRSKYPTESPLTKFDEWYETQTKDDTTNKTTTIKTQLGGN